jgi:hypothetical protein
VVIRAMAMLSISRSIRRSLKQSGKHNSTHSPRFAEYHTLWCAD